MDGKFRLFGVEIEQWTVAELHEAIEQCIISGQQAEFLNVNVHAMNLLFANPDFFAVMNTADHVFCDGEGVRRAVNFRGGSIPCRITYADWMKVFLPWVAERGFRIFFLGAKPEVIEKAVANCRKFYPLLKIVGFSDGFCDTNTVLEQMNEKNTQILLTGMGMPKQELWIRKHRQDLSCNVFLSGGAVFDYLSGTVSRAPSFMCNNCLEWLYRLLIEPRRMFSRYVIGNPLFVYRLLTGKEPAHRSPQDENS
jgi:N-acetylglucosaminyldiphosphoundecaprenol N-acetyl-beta-D-mannosaminyltransferase